ncbi:putative photosynthetic complex assembly protein [Roseivivax lentus]|uniref:Putative photosynthetic complex assembly protein n=1 Tax=Roseivivax lentus TaxID=633194 RepID=A0A1N7JM76_9RHOB|nr:photosynthetic complex assembly protein PuhC [Roseivivax lentus]SIS50371.1 putative photosynthetic complex assembly protein [Roseivivax lentus]
MSTNTQPSLRHEDRDLVPLVLVRAMTALVLVILALTSFWVWTDRPLEALPPESPVAQERIIFLAGEMSGAARVLDQNGTVIVDFGPKEGGFIAGVARVLERERTNARQPLDGPVRLVAYENGRMGIFDPSTGWRADLMGFGADNAAAFARLLRD